MQKYTVFYDLLYKYTWYKERIVYNLATTYNYSLKGEVEYEA